MRIKLSLLDHPSSGGLREKIRAAQVDSDQPIKTLRRRIENIGPRLRRDPGIVDQHIQAAKLLADFGELAFWMMVTEIGHVRLDAINRTKAARRF